MSKVAELTASRARELLAYDAETGVLTRRASLSRSVKIGEVAGYVHPTKGRLYLYVDSRRYLAHRVAWLIVHGRWPLGQIDHINGNKADNSIINLRDVDAQTNGQNRREPSGRNTSGLLGASWMPAANKWRAQLHVGGKPLYLGLFDTKEAANAAYLEAKRRHHAGCTI